MLYSFYKNILYLIPQFWFGFYSGFSGQSPYDLFIFQCYNFMFTSLPIIVSNSRIFVGVRRVRLGVRAP